MHRFLALLSSIALAACAGSTARGPQPELMFVQISGPLEQSYPAGDIEVQYGMQIENRGQGGITLRRIEVESVGAGGAYRLLRASYYFNTTVPSQTAGEVTFWAKAIALGDSMSDDARAPITVRGTAFFESPEGSFRKVFVKMLPQADGSFR